MADEIVAYMHIFIWRDLNDPYAMFRFNSAKTYRFVILSAIECVDFINGRVMTQPPIIIWFRRDLRLSDLPMLAAAHETGRPIIPVFICDEEVAALGAAARWRLGL